MPTKASELVRGVMDVFGILSSDTANVLRYNKKIKSNTSMERWIQEQINRRSGVFLMLEPPP